MRVDRSGGILHVSEGLRTLRFEWHGRVIHTATSDTGSKHFQCSPLCSLNSLLCLKTKKVQDSMSPPGLRSALCSKPFLWVLFSLHAQALSAGGLETGWIWHICFWMFLSFSPCCRCPVLWGCTWLPVRVSFWLKWGWGVEEDPENLVTIPLLPHSVVPQSNSREP